MIKSKCDKCNSEIEFLDLHNEKTICKKCGKINNNKDYFPKYTINKINVGCRKSKNYQTYEVVMDVDVPSNTTLEQRQLIIRRIQAECRMMVMEQIRVDDGE